MFDELKVMASIAGAVTGVVVMTTVVVGGPLVFAHEVFGKHACSNYERITGVDSQWVSFDECYIKHDGEWVRYGAYEQMIIAEDGLNAISRSKN